MLLASGRAAMLFVLPPPTRPGSSITALSKEGESGASSEASPPAVSVHPVPALPSVGSEPRSDAAVMDSESAGDEDSPTAGMSSEVPKSDASAVIQRRASRVMVDGCEPPAPVVFACSHLLPGSRAAVAQATAHFMYLALIALSTNAKFLAAGKEAGCSAMAYRNGAKYWTTLIIAPANISVLNDAFAWFSVPLIAVGCFWFIPPTYWTLQNLKDSESKQYILDYGSILSAATVCCEASSPGP
jgi:hypothetical protein